jgi:hypothetical protein
MVKVDVKSQTRQTFQNGGSTLVPINCAKFFIMFNYYELSANPYPSDSISI